MIRVWQYDVSPGREQEFEWEYGAAGSWARLFAANPGFGGTELYRCLDVPGRYLTIDRFTDAASWEKFCSDHRREYDALDARCAPLTRNQVDLLAP